MKKKLSLLLTLAIGALSWTTTTTPMLRAFAGRIGSAARAIAGCTRGLRTVAEQYRDEVLADKGLREEREVKMSCALDLGLAAIEGEVTETFDSNEHDLHECGRVICDLLEQKKAEADVDSLLRANIEIEISNDPDDNLVARTNGLGLWVNACKFPTIDCLESAAAHELVHIDRNHIYEHPAVSKMLSQEAKQIIRRWYETEADIYSVFDYNRGNGNVTLNGKRYAGYRRSISHFEKRIRALYDGLRDFVRPIIADPTVLTDEDREMIAPYDENDFEVFCKNMDPEHPTPQERLNNLNELGCFANRHGWTFPKQVLDGHAKNSVDYQEAAFLLGVVGTMGERL